MRKTAGIHERNDRIRVSYDLGPDPVSGERRQRWHTMEKGATKADARIWRANKISEIARGIRPDPKQLTLGAYLTEWLERFHAEHPETRTWYSWRSYLTKHLIPLIGHVKLSRLDAGVIASAYRNIPPKMIRYVQAALHRALEDAMSEGLIARNWAHGAKKRIVQPDVTRRPQENVWNEQQLSAFLAAARFDDRFGYAVWRTLAMTGMRMGEVLGLSPADIDLEAATVTVRRQWSLSDGKPSLRAPKTRQSNRRIDIDLATVTALRLHQKAQEARKTEVEGLGLPWASEFLFTRSDGTPLHPRSFDRRLHELAKRASVPEISPHGLRHTHATILLRQGRSIAYVAQRLGHTPEVLLSVYAHVLEQDGAEAARGFADVIDGGLAR